MAVSGTKPIATVGRVEIHRVEELVIPTSVRWLLPDVIREVVQEARSWLVPRFMNEEGYLLQSIHTYVLRTPDRLILVDTGVGNGKQRGGAIPAFNMLDTPFLDRLAAAGVRPEEVAVVLCTHMHTDHVGWDARMVDGRWTPTFPNARHLFAEPEYAYWSSAPGNDTGIMADSIRPVAEAGLVDLVPVDHPVCPEVRLEPSHGHSPGHVSVRVESEGQSAVLIGDVMHSPLQCLFPRLKPALDRTEEPARSARLALLERYAETGTLVLGAHFAGAGYIRRDREAFRFEAAE